MPITMSTLFSFILDNKNYLIFSLFKQYNNNLFIYLNPPLLILFFSILKYSIFCRPTIFLELSAFDNIFCGSTILYCFLLLFFKIRVFFFLKNETSFIQTCNFYFFNSTWSEREIEEMHNINFDDKFDSRHLLLDYSFIGFPMQKIFSVSGYFELVYNFIKSYVEYTDTLLQESSKPNNQFDF